MQDHIRYKFESELDEKENDLLIFKGGMLNIVDYYKLDYNHECWLHFIEDNHSLFKLIVGDGNETLYPILIEDEEKSDGNNADEYYNFHYHNEENSNFDDLEEEDEVDNNFDKSWEK